MVKKTNMVVVFEAFFFGDVSFVRDVYQTSNPDLTFNRISVLRCQLSVHLEVQVQS